MNTETVAERETTTTETQQPCPEQGTFCWNELVSNNTNAAARFYTGLFGWKTDPFPGNIPYTLFSLNGRQIGGLMACSNEKMPPRWLAYIMVEDVDATAKKAVELGAKITIEPTDIPHRRQDSGARRSARSHTGVISTRANVSPSSRGT